MLFQGKQWLPEAMDFLQANRAVLQKVPVAVFLVCMTLAMSNADRYHDEVATFLDPVRAIVTPVSEGMFAGLRLRLRVDRVDRVDGGLVIIDYKTGRAETGQWRGARPDAPQLPLYAALQDGEVSAIAFAAVGAHAARFLGVGAGDGIADGIVPAAKFALTEDKQTGFTWQQVKDRWTGWLASLARAYVEGDAAVDPKGPQTCRLCHLSTLCRVSPELDGDALEAGDE